jgi:hypothetical protein
MKAHINNVRPSRDLQQVFCEIRANAFAKLGVFVEQRVVLNLPRLRDSNVQPWSHVV